ncbi:DUF2218 domain-containing protein [Actinopolyspora mortivallis]|uniref:DUF2218 domain-containing protein n=1 Tax=Actinopolyspora mortivallis TaxID=33906 RepID=UPI00035EBBD8|nr:DUF2218 domain-containing protein [Actinopolyspora mortivallis]
MQAHAEVNTDRAHRYLKQLVSHPGRHCSVEEGDGQTRITLPPDHGTGRCVFRPRVDGLTIAAEADNDEDLAHLQHVIASHLERFGQRDGLSITWLA